MNIELGNKIIVLKKIQLNLVLLNWIVKCLLVQVVQYLDLIPELSNPFLLSKRASVRQFSQTSNFDRSQFYNPLSYDDEKWLIWKPKAIYWHFT